MREQSETEITYKGNESPQKLKIIQFSHSAKITSNSTSEKKKHNKKPKKKGMSGAVPPAENIKFGGLWECRGKGKTMSVGYAMNDAAEGKFVNWNYPKNSNSPTQGTNRMWEGE